MPNLSLGTISSARVPLPVNTVLPAVTGTYRKNQTLSVSNGTWTGDATITYSYQWLRSPTWIVPTYTAISGATSSTYTLVSADVGSHLYCRVTATNSHGSFSVEDSGGALGANYVYDVFSATGGTTATSGGYTYHTFTASGNFVIAANSFPTTVEYQLIGGGGAGTSFLNDKGSNPRSGGGGGGGDFQSGSFSNMTAATYTVTVGGGGSPSTNPTANKGTSSRINGNSFDSGSYGTGGGYGGSSTTFTGEAGTGGSGSGGNGGYTNNTNQAGGGGGGSTGNGSAASGTTWAGGNGGTGTSTWTTASTGAVTAQTKGGGGGGGGYGTTGTASGGGGAGGTGSGTSGTANLGGGGGGAGSSGTGGNGGSGCVIVRYVTP